MIFQPKNAILQHVLVHKDCGGYVEQDEWMRRFLSEFYTCPRCSTLLHRNNVRRDPYFAFA